MGFSLIAATALLSITLLMICSIAIDKLEPTLQNIQTAQIVNLQRRIDQINTDIEIINATTNWWDNLWLYRKLITLNSSQITDDFVNFTILIDTTDSGIRDHAQSNGNDIAFVNYNGTVQYNHEIEDYDNSTGHLIAWVLIPTLSSTEDTLLYLYYGNSAATNQENPTATWDENYTAVWHFNNNSLSDSTNNGYDGTNSGTSYASSCKIAGGRDYNGDDRIDINNFAALTTAKTAEMWVFRDNSDTSTFIRLFTKGPSWDNNDWCLYWRTADDEMRYVINSNDYQTGGSYSQQNSWFHIAVTYDSGDVILYDQGSLEIDWSGLFGASINDNFGTLTLGNQNNGGRPWIGKLDEVRISNISRSEEWLETSYNSMNSPSTFADIGAEQSILTNKIDVAILITNNGKKSLNTEGFTIIFNGKITQITCPKTYLLPTKNVTCNVLALVTGYDRIKVISAEGIANYYIYES